MASLAAPVRFARHRVLPNRVVAALTVTTLAVGLGFSARPLAERDEVPSVPDSTVTIVREFAVAVTSFDHRRLQEDIDRVLGFGTESFRDDFTKAMGPDFADRITKAATLSKGEILAGPTVQRRRGDRASLFVVVNQQITSTTEPTPGARPGSSQIVRVGLLVTVDLATNKVASVQVL